MFKEATSKHQRRKIIEDGATEKGGWTADQLKKWGVPWPPPSGWKKEIIKNGFPDGVHIEQE